MSAQSPELVLQWERASALLTEAKATEMRLRKAVIELHFGALLEGSNTVDNVESGNELLKLVATQPYSYKVDASLPESFANTPMFRKKVELEKKEYNKLNGQQKKAVQEWLLITPGTPSLKVTHTQQDD